MANVNMYETGSRDRMKWWLEARFGMFIHWGLYSSLGGEWKGRRSRFSGGYDVWQLIRELPHGI